MATTPVNLPSINIPFTNSQGCINPIWHEFLRSFVTGAVDGTIVDPGVAPQVVAGNGLVGGGPITSDVPLRVGQGSGIAVNADDVSVDIFNTTYDIGTLEDEILYSDVSNNNAIRKTKLKDVAGLSSPGGLNSQIQYNNNGLFGGSPTFTYDGVNTLTLNNLTVNGVNFSSANNAGTSPFVFSVPAGNAANHFTFTQSGLGSSDMPLAVKCLRASSSIEIANDTASSGSTTSQSILYFSSANTTRWCMGLTGSNVLRTFTFGTTGLNTGNVYTIDATNRFFTINSALVRRATTGITASTTQTQGQGALTAEVNEISTCANVNDTVTLPVATAAGRYNLVINNGAQTAQVFPASGGNLGSGLNTSTTILAGSSKMFIATSATVWKSVILTSGTSSGGMTMNTASGTTQALAVANGYICTNAAQCNGTLPATAAVGDRVLMVSQGAGGIKMTANTGQTIKGLGNTTTSAGSISCAAQYDDLAVICIVANTTWAVEYATSSLLTFA